ncbi:zinc ribbon domain-containing protein [Candidatus Chloroploca asiatica]|uniref:Zinc ribbon domain-containing protein n=1 Tax=Candidatus Chloroploca asiatica TaxID=1506545 RepID=A0A2H3KK66_9CHLR|nr:zinc ribbon domain-containing protein [Candidatus Chloroploca asiatica]PDV98360.1 hypothetical protein A9Q02_15875 [Candidatus Chloroploca asiatica]
MVERICPVCQHGNPMENRFCGACGASLEQHALAQRPSDALVIAGQTIPLTQVRQVGKAVAVGLAAVAVEAGIAWLRRRSEPTSLAVVPQTTTLTPSHGLPQAEAVFGAVTIVSQRVVEIWDHGNLTRQIVEKHVWKKEG